MSRSSAPLRIDPADLCWSRIMLSFRWNVLLALLLSTAATAETVDTTFANGGRVVFNNSTIAYRAVATLPLPNGDFVQVFEIPNTPGVCADVACVGLIKRTPGGTLIDSRSKAAGLSSVTAATLDNSARIVVVGATVPGANGRDFGIVRFRADLADDVLFAGDGGTAFAYNARDEFPTAVAVDARDNIVVVGSFSISATDTDFGIVRVRGNGTLDSGFNGVGYRSVAFDLGSGLLLDQANAVAIGNDGRIVVVGTAIDGSISRTRVGIARLNNDGSADTTFCNPDCSTNTYPGINSGFTTYYFGSATAHSDEGLAVDVLGDQRIVLAGTTYTIDGSSRQGAIARLNANGSFSAERRDDGLGGNAAFRSVRSADANGTRLIVGGDSGPAQNYFLVQAFNTNLSPVLDYGNCQTSNSGFCFVVGTGLGDNGPDTARDLVLDAYGRPLFSGDGVPSAGQNRYVISTRFTNSSGPLPDRIFRNGFN
jgi:uncharacterized delta-60 repeat protein